MASKKEDINNLQEKYNSVLDKERDQDFDDYLMQISKCEGLLEDHKIIERDLEAIGDKISNLTGRAAKLEQDLDDSSTLLENRTELVNAWKELQLLLEDKIKSQEKNLEIQHFLNEATVLINWAISFKNKFISDTTSDKLTEIQAEISEHSDLAIVLSERKKEFLFVKSTGSGLADFQRPNMVTRGSMLENLDTSLSLAEEAWSERNKHLQEVQAYHIFCRESNSILKKIRHVQDQIDEEQEMDTIDEENDTGETPVDQQAPLGSHNQSLKGQCKDIDGLRRKRGFKTSVKRQLDTIEADFNELKNVFSGLDFDHYNYGDLKDRKEELENDLSDLIERLKRLNMDYRESKSLYTYLRDYEILFKNLKDKALTIRNLPIPKNNVSLAIEQHEQIKSQINALQPEKESLVNSENAPVDKASDLSLLWEQVNALADEKLSQLKDAETNEKFDRQCDDLKSYLDEVEVKINVPPEEICKDMTSSKDAINRHTDLSKDYTAHKPEIELMEQKANECGATTVAEGLTGRYHALAGQISSKAVALEQYVNAFELAAEINDVDEWIKQKFRQVDSKDVGKDLLSCLRLKAKHSDISTELSNNKQKTEALIERGKREKVISIVPELADKLKNDWEELNEKCSVRTDLLSTAKTTHEYFVEADASIAWLHEKIPLVNAEEMGQTEDLADIILSRHKQLTDEINAYKPRIDELRTLAVNCKIDELDVSDPNSPTHQISSPEPRSVQKTQRMIEDNYNNLLEKANDRKEELAKNSKTLALQREAADLLRWIAEKEKEIADSYAEARAKGDLDAAKEMLDRSEKEMRAGQKRLNDLLNDAKKIGVNLENVNPEDIMANWQNLQKKYEDMNDMLSGAYKLQRFLQDCIETNEWIDDKNRILLTIEPNAENINITAINAMRRRHETLQRDLQALGDRIHDLDKVADQLVKNAQEGKLQPQIINNKLIDMDKIVEAETIQTKRNELNIAWNDLVTTCKSKKKQLNFAEQYHKFLGDKAELENWIENMHSVMNPENATETEPKDMADAQNLIDRHNSIFTDLESRNNDFSKLSAAVKKLDEKKHPKSNQIIKHPKIDLIKDHLEDLIDKKRKLMAAWQEKESKLTEVYKLKKFERDVQLCINWIKNRENVLAKLDQAPADTDLQKANNLKKSAEIQKQIDNYQSRIDNICKMADDLIDEEYYASDRVIIARDTLLERWNNLHNGLKHWQKKLGNSQHVQQFLNDATNMNDWLDEKKSSFPQLQGQPITDNEVLKARQQRQDTIKAEIEANKAKLQKLLERGNDLLDKQNSNNDSENAEKLMNAINKLSDKMGDLEDLSSKNTQFLADAEQQIDWQTALKDFEMWVDEMRILIENSPINFGHLEDAKNASVKHNNRIQEIDNQKGRLSHLEKNSLKLINSEKFSNIADEISSKMQDITSKYESLASLANRRDRILNDMITALELQGNINGETEWANSATNEVNSTQTPESKADAEQAIRRLASMEDDVSDRKNRYFTTMQEQAKEIKSDNNQLSDGLVALSSAYTTLSNAIIDKNHELMACLKQHAYNELLSELTIWLKNQINIMQLEIQDCPEQESLNKALAAKRKFTQLWASYQNVYQSKINDFNELGQLKSEFEVLSQQRKSMIDSQVAYQEFQWKCQAILTWIFERNNQLEERNVKPIRHFSEIDGLISQHQVFQVGLRVFEDEALENLRNLANTISESGSEATTNSNVKTLLENTTGKWKVLIEVSSQRQILLEKAKKEFEAFDLLLLEFAQQASSFNTWYEKLVEEFSNPVYADSVEDIRGQSREFQELKAKCKSKLEEIKNLSDLNEKIQTKHKNSENPYTWHTMATISDLWEQVQKLLEDRENGISEELNKQEIADRLCQSYATEANTFYKYLSDIKSVMNEKHDSNPTSPTPGKNNSSSSNLENHLKNLEKLSEDLKNNKSLLTSVENKAAQLEAQGVYDKERYTKHSLVKLSQQYDQMKNQNIKMQHNLIQQINAMNSSGVPEELLRDINIMFKHFDKDNTGYVYGLRYSSHMTCT